MKKLLMGLGAALASLTFSSPMSADDYYPVAYNNYTNYCNQPAFEGFYIGGNVGFLGYSANYVDRSPPLFGFASFVANNTSWAAGVQLGYDWRCCSQLFGLVADWDWSNAKTSIRLDPNDPTLDSSIKGRLRWITTIRARAGLVIDDLLLYLTGGAAVANLRTEVFINTTTAGLLITDQSTSKTHWGWTVGFGTELAFWSNWSLNAEVLYTRFRKQSGIFSANTSQQMHVDYDSYSDAWLGRLGLNYHFSFSDFW